MKKQIGIRVIGLGWKDLRHTWSKMCRGPIAIVAAKRNSRVHIRWDDDNVREGEPNIMEERFLVSKWNKQVEEGWCFVISED